MEERRIVTILFCDITGSTAIAEQLDPEDWAEIMEEMFPYLIHPVEQYDGTIARLMGDAILAFFGAPRAHEDDPQRAIHAALDIINGIQPFREQIAQKYRLDLNVRIGINTGLVVVGEFGTEGAFEYTAMGDAINLAARMEQTAEPGTIQISHDTYRLVAPFFKVDALDQTEFRGKSEAVQTYRVLDRQNVTGRLWDVRGMDIAFAGREHERAALQRALVELQQGRGQIISLIGEAGLGKSRLLTEFHRYSEHTWSSPMEESDLSSPIWILYQGISYESSKPYGALQHWIRSITGIERDNSIATIRDRINSNLEFVPEETRKRAAEVLEYILTTGEGRDSRSIDLAATLSDATVFERELLSVLQALLRGRASTQPLVFLLDDLQWVDLPSAEQLIQLFQLTDYIPVLFLCAFRPQRSSPAWQVKQAAEADFHHRYSEFLLHPLTTEESIAMIDAAIVDTKEARQLQSLILEKAEGNPLFVEEIIRNLADQQFLEPETDAGARWRLKTGRHLETISIPDSVQALLLERVDGLDSRTRETLQKAAVIGRTFSYATLETMTSVDDELEARLSVLQRADLIRESAWLPDREYTFRHHLIWEAAYHTILRRRLRRWHREVGEILADQDAADPDTVAYHFLHANDTRAADWLILAGQRAARVYAFLAAIEHYEQALSILEGDDNRQSEYGWLICSLAEAHRYTDPRKAITYLDSVQTLFDGLDDPALKTLVLWSRAHIRGFLGENALDELQRAAKSYDELTQRDRERIARSSLNYVVGKGNYAQTLARHGLYEEALHRAQAYLDQIGDIQAPIDRHELGHALLGLGIARAALGQPTQARESFASAFNHLRNGGILHLGGIVLGWDFLTVLNVYYPDDPTERRRLMDVATEAWQQSIYRSSVNQGQPANFWGVLLLDGRWDEARQNATAIYSIVAERAYATRILAELDRLQGHPEKAWSHINIMFPGGPRTEPSTRYYLHMLELQRVAAELALDEGNLPSAMQWIEALEHWQGWSNIMTGRATPELLRSRYHLLTGDLLKSRTHAENSLERAHEPRQPLAILAAHRRLARIAIQSERIDDATRHLDEAESIAADCETPYELALVTLARAALLQTTGDLDSAHTLLTEVQAICEPISAKLALNEIAKLAQY